MVTKVIAIDVMSGDYGLDATLDASARALKTYPDIKLMLVGDQKLIQSRLSVLTMPYEIIHASEVIDMDEPVSQALRNKKDSSMRRAIDLVKKGKAQACVSAGNTGALMATAKYLLKTLPGISRPAIMTSLPTITGSNVRMLDLGANLNASAEQLLQFALMGSIAACHIAGIERPKVGLLNIGEESIKGNGPIKQAAKLLSAMDEVNYFGYVEGDAIYQGVVDVVVCDGFVGNVALKASEGAARLITYYAKKEFTRNRYSQCIATLARPVLKRLMKRIDPRAQNGATLLGLNGIVIKSHGSADSYAFFNAIEEAMLEIDKQLATRIGDSVSLILQKRESL